MAALDLRRHFSRFRAAAPGRINLAAHSHHDWPDVSFDAQVEAWEDAARLANGKWDRVFGTVMPEAAAGVARRLALPDPATLAFAPNTHGLLLRLLSALPTDRPARILTSDGEFHSFRRQAARLEEDGLLAVTRVPSEPAGDFPERFRQAMADAAFDMVFVSHVFFTSGATCGDLGALAAAAPAGALVVVDGYHGFLARPTSLAAVAGRLFYMAGGYKYAMAGENACFLHAPPALAERPRDTGWFADFGALAAPPGRSVGYPADGGRFLGATFDPVGLYRLRAVLAWLDREALTVEAIHAHATAQMARFLDRLDGLGLPDLGRQTLLTPFGAGTAHGNFLAFRTARAGAVEAVLGAHGVSCDHRGDRLRFGFGLSTTLPDVDEAADRLAKVVE